MKIFKIISLATVVLFFVNGYGQTGVLKNQAPVQPAYKAHAEGWLVDVNEAFALSEKTGKPIMANFTGSDWCGWCKKLKREVFDTPQFKTWADKSVVLLELDFPRRFKLPENIQKQNRELQQAFKVSGYPTIWVFNLNKNEAGQYGIEALGKTGYVRGVSAFTGGVDDMIKRAGAVAN